MQLVHESVSLYTHSSPLQKVEEIGRVCWASEGNITASSAKNFVKMLINKKHTSVLEHVWVTLSMDAAEIDMIQATHPKYLVITDGFVTGNIRALREYCAKWPVEAMAMLLVLRTEFPDFFEDVKPLFGDTPARELGSVRVCASSELSEDLKQDHVPYTFKFQCDRGITHELVRHRVFTFTQSSTRFIKYLNIEFADEGFFPKGIKRTLWKTSLAVSALVYKWLIKLGAKPQEARSILPNATMATIYMTGSRRQWEEFLILRESPGAHPSVRKLAASVREQL